MRLYLSGSTPSGSMTISTTGRPSNMLRFWRTFFLGVVEQTGSWAAASSGISCSNGWTGGSNSDSWFGSRWANFSLLRPNNWRFNQATWASSSWSLFCSCSFCRVRRSIDSDWELLACWSVATKSSNVSVWVIRHTCFEQYKNTEKQPYNQGFTCCFSVLHVTFS